LETAVKKLYEGMFLVDSAEAAADWDAIVTRIKSILEKTGAEIVSLRKWDERKLAYEINGKARGTYILCYFSSDGERIQEIEREAQLSEQIIRVLILCADHMSQEDIAKDTPATRAKKSQQQTALADKVEVRQKEDAQEAEQADESEQPESKN
jgi:small subunit ribosomal protein S6